MTISIGFKRAVFDQATATTFEVVEHPGPGKKIRVRGLFLSAVGIQLATFKSANDSIGATHLAAASVISLVPTDGDKGEVWMECAEDESLNLTLTQAVQTDGVLFYDVVNITGVM